MIALFALLALAACVSAETDTKIVGGSDATYGDHPYIGSLQARSGTSWYHICGAVIYNQNTIVTAAHCLGNSASSYRVLLGNHRLNNNDAHQAAYTFSGYTRHPNYNGNAAGYPNDIACMKTSSTISFNSHVSAISFDNGGSWAGQSCVLSGWGRLTGGGSLPNTLQKVSITKITNSNCASRWASISGASINNGHICFYTGSGISACNGDSGGPATCGNTLVGITSWGISNCSGSYPSVYTRVSQFQSFLNSC
nr:hypothetical protein BaRGS_032561 [Batillaria attramentaria]